jgi:hypothetical protein
MRSRIVFVLLIGFLVGCGGSDSSGSSPFETSSQSPRKTSSQDGVTDTEDDETESTDETANTAPVALTLDDQVLEEPNRLTATEVKTDRPVRVGIHRTSPNEWGQRGAFAIGHSEVIEDDSTDISIDIHNAFALHQKLYAVLYRVKNPDNPPRRINAEQKPVTDRDGDIIYDSFKVSMSGVKPSNYNLEIADQSVSSSGKIEVNSAQIGKREAFIVLHAGGTERPKPSTVRGHSQLLKTGTHRDISIEFNRQIREETRLKAVIHYDFPADGKFNYFFPVRANDEMPARTTDGDLIADSAEISPASTSAQTNLSVADQTVSPSRTLTINRAVFESKKARLALIEGSDPFSGDVFEAGKVLEKSHSRPFRLAIERYLDESKTLTAVLYEFDLGTTFDERTILKDEKGRRLIETFEAKPANIEPGEYSLNVNDQPIQQVQRTGVKIESVTTGKHDVWIAITGLNKFGSIVAHSQLIQENHAQDLFISKHLEPGEYTAYLRVDDPADGTFGGRAFPPLTKDGRIAGTRSTTSMSFSVTEEQIKRADNE